MIGQQGFGRQPECRIGGLFFLMWNTECGIRNSKSRTFIEFSQFKSRILNSVFRIWKAVVKSGD